MRPTSEETILLLLGTLRHAGVRYAEPSQELLRGLLGLDEDDGEDVLCYD